MRENYELGAWTCTRTQGLKKPTRKTEFIEVLFLQNAVPIGWLECGEQMLV